MATLSSSIAKSDSIAIIVPGNDGHQVTYLQYHSHISSVQQKLAKLGVTPQSAVTIALPNSYAFAVTFIAVATQRAICAPINQAYTEDEAAFYIDDLGSALVAVPKGAYKQNAAAVRAARKYQAAIAEVYWNGSEVVLDVKEPGKLKGQGNVGIETSQPEDTALVLHTSGTTGRPKAVPLSHRNLTRTMNNIKDTYNLNPSDRTILVMPLFHVHGLLAGFLAPLISGGSVIIPSKFSASEFWDDFLTHKANWYTAVPTIHQILLKNPPPSSKPNIRFIRSCSSPLSPKVFHELEKTFDAPVVEAYAMTEAAHQMTSNLLPPGKRKPGTVGVGQGVDIKILDQQGNEVIQGSEAEICIRGSNVTKGYLNNPKANEESFTKGGFFRTGDQGKLDEDGYVVITGRIKELINKGGEKISPIELDNVMAQNPAVSEAVSFAIPDDMYGQDVAVAIVLKPGQELSADGLRKWMKEKVVKFKLPKKVYFTDNMPKTATGKIQRRVVADAMQKQEKQQSKL